jgi:hypothetical protein
VIEKSTSAFETSSDAPTSRFCLPFSYLNIIID